MNLKLIISEYFFFLRGHSMTMWTQFCPFLTTYLPLRRHFQYKIFTLNVDKNRHLFGPPTYLPEEVFFSLQSLRGIQKKVIKYLNSFFRLFEMVVKYFDAFLNLIPLSFVLGFYVSIHHMFSRILNFLFVIVFSRMSF